MCAHQLACVCGQLALRMDGVRVGGCVRDRAALGWTVRHTVRDIFGRVRDSVHATRYADPECQDEPWTEQFPTGMCLWCVDCSG